MDTRALCAVGVATALAAAWVVYQATASSAGRTCSRHRRRKHGQGGHETAHDRGWDSDDADVDIPDHYKDPISLSIIVEPVVLCATGQVYCYSTIREWFKTGNRLCPRTNMEVQDVQLARLPWLKHEIQQWCEQHDIDLPEDASSEAAEKLRAINRSLPGWTADIRGDSGLKRVQAAAAIYELLRQWELEAGEDDMQQQQQQQQRDLMAKPHVIVRTAIMDDMVWLLRYGDSYMQGVAASTLSFCSTPDEVQWLAPTATTPTVALCLCPQAYTAQAATRLLYNLARAGSTARLAIHAAGGTLSLLKIISTSRQEFGYSRDRAAATLAILSKEPEVKVYLQPLALQPLKSMLREGDRYEQRDASTALLGLLYTEAQLQPETNIDQLFKYFWCSRAWLEGRAEQPDEAYTQEEVQLRSNLGFWRANAHAFIDQLLPKDLAWVLAAEPQDEGQEVEDPGEQQDEAAAV